VPVPRAQLATLQAQLTTLVNPLKPASPGMVFQRKPIESLRGLLAVRLAPPVLNPDSIQLQAWKGAIAQNPLLWYVRRRNLQVRADAIAAPVQVAANEIQNEQDLVLRLTDAGLLDRFNALKARSSATGVADLTKRLSSQAVADNPVLAASVISTLEKAPQLDRVTVLEATEQLVNPGLGEGLAQIKVSNPGVADPEVMKALADSGAAAELDTIGRTVDKAALTDVTNQVIAIAKTAGADAPAQINTLLKDRVKSPVRITRVIR